MGLIDFFFGTGKSQGGKKTNKPVAHSFSIDRSMVENKWTEINQLVDMGGPSRMRSAIVEADKLLDYALKSKGLPGENMGERLKNAKDMMSYKAYDCAWKGHKLRNMVVHEIEAEIFQFKAKEALRDFETALQDLRVL
jgi:hypothetical protein